MLLQEGHCRPSMPRTPETMHAQGNSRCCVSCVWFSERYLTFAGACWDRTRFSGGSRFIEGAGIRSRKMLLLLAWILTEIFACFCRNANADLRWLMLHRKCRQKKLKDVVTVGLDPEKVLLLLLHTAQLEFKVSLSVCVAPLCCLPVCLQDLLFFCSCAPITAQRIDCNVFVRTQLSVFVTLRSCTRSSS